MISSIMLPAASFPINGKFLYEEAVKNTRVFSTGKSSLITSAANLLDLNFLQLFVMNFFSSPKFTL